MASGRECDVLAWWVVYLEQAMAVIFVQSSPEAGWLSQPLLSHLLWSTPDTVLALVRAARGWENPHVIFQISFSTPLCYTPQFGSEHT